MTLRMSPSVSPSASPSASVSPSASPAPSSSASPSASASPSPSLSPSVSGVHSASASPSPSPSPEAQELSLQERIFSISEQLSASAETVNVKSDELTKPVGIVDDFLKSLNLGVTAWVQFAGHEDLDLGRYWERSIGYTKISRWGIAIRASSGDFGDEPTEETWLFADAPRAYRIEAVDKLPELLERLVAATNDTAEKLKEKISTTNQLAAVVAQSPAAIKAKFLAELKAGKQVLYTVVVPRVHSLEITMNRLCLRFSSPIPKLFAQIEQNRGWLEELAQRVTGRKVTLSIEVVGSANE